MEQLTLVNWQSLGWFIVINAFLLLLIATRISYMRMTQKIPYGDGGEHRMQNTIRAHANGVEHLPIFTLLCLMIVGLGGHALLNYLLLVFTLSRLSHAYGMCFKQFNARRLGAALTYLCQGLAIVVLAALLLN